MEPSICPVCGDWIHTCPCSPEEIAAKLEGQRRLRERLNDPITNKEHAEDKAFLASLMDPAPLSPEEKSKLAHLRAIKDEEELRERRKEFDQAWGGFMRAVIGEEMDDRLKEFGEKMGGLERMVWAAAYANEFARSLDFILKYKSNQTIDNVSGFSCAEIADVAVEKLREALTGDDREYLLPVKEGWKDA